MTQEPFSENETSSNYLLRPMESKSIVDRIINRLTGAIMAGDLKPGQRIPTEAELSISMQVGRNSVREAIKSLVTMGVLNIRRSEGTFVAEGFSERMMAPMLYGLALEGGTTYALVELRVLLETGILQMAIDKATEEDIIKLKEALHHLEKTAKEQPDAETLQDADISFHSILQQSIHNPLVNKVYEMVELLSMPTRILAVKQFIEKGELDKMAELHAEIIRIIEERDKQRVPEAIEMHFRYWMNKLQ